MDFRTVRARAQKPTTRQKKAAEGLAAGKPIQTAMLEAGYAPGTARLGMQAVPLTVQALGMKGSSVYRVGKALTTDDMRALAIGRLAINVTEGKDGGVMSAKTLGSHRELNLWTSETQVGVMVINAPETSVKPLADVPEETPENPTKE